jgi:hypothetical protein
VKRRDGKEGLFVVVVVVVLERERERERDLTTNQPTNQQVA